MDSECPVVECWACKIWISVPLLSGKPAQRFKCGWCGALNELPPHHQQQYPQNHQGDQHASRASQQQVPSPEQRGPLSPGALQVHLPSAQQHMQPSKPSSRWKQLAQRCTCVCMSTGRWAIIAFVVLLVGSIAGTGIIVLLPRVCTTWLTYVPNVALSVLLLFSVAFNYAAAVMQSPGRVLEFVPVPPRGPHGEVLQGSFELYSWCRHCRSPKPPQAHHCRTCGHCVVNMDHHCPFINNCVGRGNLRPFLLFLVWTLLAASYMLLMCGILAWQQWDVVRSASLHAQVTHSSSSGGSGRGGRGALANNASIDSLPPLSTPAGPDTSFPASQAAGSSSIAAENAAGAVTALPGERAAAVEAVELGGGRQWSSGWLLASTGVFFVLLQLAPGWLLATYYLAAASAALLLAVGALLCSQLSYLARGVTYIEHLKGAAAAGTATAGSKLGSTNGAAQEQEREVLSVSVATVGAQSVQAGCTQPSGLRPQLLWMRVKEVLGAGSSCTDLVKALLVPRWHSQLQALPQAAKKLT